jgi:hypothetical protein
VNDGATRADRDLGWDAHFGLYMTLCLSMTEVQERIGLRPRNHPWRATVKRWSPADHS